MFSVKQNSGQEVTLQICIFGWTFTAIFLNTENVSYYLVSYFSYISQDNIWESYNHLNFMIFVPEFIS